MDELPLTKELYLDVIEWMETKYAISTIKGRATYLKKLFKKYKVLNKETLKAMFRSFKHPQDKACLVMINTYCSENNIDFFIIIQKMKYKKHKIPDLLSSSEIALMVSSAPYPYGLTIRCIFNMGAGLRISEIIKMSWKDIRWIDWLNNKESYGVVVIKQGKGGKDRVVNIPNKLMADLYDYAKERNVLNEFGIPNGSFIFDFGGLDEVSGKNNKYLKKHISPKVDDNWKYLYIKSKYNWFRYNILQKHSEKALNKKIHIHQLRHSRATYLYEIEKQSIGNIQKLLGHTSIETTMRYIHIDVKGIFEEMKDTMEL